MVAGIKFLYLAMFRVFTVVLGLTQPEVAVCVPNLGVGEEINNHLLL